MSPREAQVLILCFAITALTSTIAEIEYFNHKRVAACLWICASCWMVMASVVIN